MRQKRRKEDRLDLYGPCVGCGKLTTHRMKCEQCRTVKCRNPACGKTFIWSRKESRYCDPCNGTRDGIATRNAILDM